MKERICVPSLYEAIWLTLAGGCLLTLSVTLDSFRDYDSKNGNFFSISVKNFIDRYLSGFNTPHWSVIITFLLWMICGILVYLATWFSVNVILSYREDSLPQQGFLTPRGYHRGAETFAAVARGLVRFLAIIATIVWLIFLLRSILPYLTSVFTVSLANINFRTPPSLLAASVLLGAALYGLIVCIRYIFLRKRIFSNIVVG